LETASYVNGGTEGGTERAKVPIDAVLARECGE
jgi:hypothetical protein